MEGLGDNDLNVGGGGSVNFEGVPLTLGGGGRMGGRVEDGGRGKLKLELGGMVEDTVDIITVGARLGGSGVWDLEAGGDEKVEPDLEAVLKDDAERLDRLEDATGTMGDESDMGMTDGC